MFKYIIKIRLAVNCFKEFYIKEERYLEPLLNVLAKYHNDEDILIIDYFGNKANKKRMEKRINQIGV
jgi:hypothetical protein